MRSLDRDVLQELRDHPLGIDADDIASNLWEDKWNVEEALDRLQRDGRCDDYCGNYQATVRGEYELRY